jgi:hypothetical protein
MQPSFYVTLLKTESVRSTAKKVCDFLLLLFFLDFKRNAFVLVIKASRLETVRGRELKRNREEGGEAKGRGVGEVRVRQF